MQNSYLSLDADPATGRRHAILDGLEDTPRIINGVFRIDVTPTTAVSVAADADPVVSGPADGGRLSARAAHRHARALPARARPEPRRLRSRGTSIARSGTCWRRPRPAAAERSSRGRPTSRRRSRSTARASSTSRVWRQRDSMTVHLVNLTNPMMMKGPLREVLPIGPLRVRVRMPARPRAARGAAADAQAPASRWINPATCCRSPCRRSASTK